MAVPELDAAYQHCQDIARSHYENFPVASWLLPARLRRPVSVIYAFARTADDFADEGERKAEERLRLLDDFGAGLDRALAGQTVDEPILLASADVIHAHALPAGLFHDLLTAFRMDVSTPRYDNQAQVLNYCHYSANPVGRLLVHLYDRASEKNLADSDAICSALQLINFYQDIQQDYRESGRVYLPQDEMAAAGISDEHIRERLSDPPMRAFMAAQRRRTRAMMRGGAALGEALPGRMGFELRMIISGGLRILNALERDDRDVYARPRLGRRDRLGMFLDALFHRLPGRRQ